MVIGLKAYSKYVTMGLVYVSNEKTIIEAMKLVRHFNKVFAFHCDDPDIIKMEGFSIRAEVEYIKKLSALPEKSLV